MCNGRARKKPFYKVFHTALMVGLVRAGDFKQAFSRLFHSRQVTHPVACD